MKTIELKGVLRTSITKVDVKKLRSEKYVPCVLYGTKEENVHFALSEDDLRPLVYTPNAYLVKLNISGRLCTAVMREIQFHPVTDSILHIDFYVVKEDKPVAIDVPITIVGTSEGVRQGGKLQILSRRVKIAGLPKDLPDTINVDISNLKLGKAILVGDLSCENVNIVTPKTTIICAVKMTRAAIGAAAAAASEEKKK